jgi:hypothetical protein
MCVVVRIEYFIKQSDTLAYLFCYTVVMFELQHFDPSSNQNTRAPILAMKLRTQKDGCLQTNKNTHTPIAMKLRTQKDGCLQKRLVV